MSTPRTLYISGPMTGYLNFNYPAFNAAANELRAAGYNVLNPVENNALNVTGEARSREWYMRHAIRQLVDADGVALLPGWASSRGACIEVDLAISLAMDRHSVGAWSEMAHRPHGTPIVQEMRDLAHEFEVNGNSRPLGDPTANTWHEAARLVFERLELFKPENVRKAHTDQSVTDGGS